MLQGEIVVLWLLEGDQVTQSLGDLVAAPLVVTVLPLRGAEEGRQFTGNRRFLCEYDNHAAVVPAVSPTPLQRETAAGAAQHVAVHG